MSHVKVQLRDRAFTELSVLAGSFPGGIYKTRKFSFREKHLNCLNIYLGDEECEPLNMRGDGQRILDRQVQLVTEIYVAASDPDFDDTIDNLGAEIEKVLGVSTLNRLAYEVTLQTGSTDFDVKAETPVGVQPLTWVVKYRTSEGDPETALI